MIKTALYILTGPLGSGSCRIRLLPSVTLVDCRLGLPNGQDYTLWLFCDGRWYRHEASRCFQWQLPPCSTLPLRPAVVDAQQQLLLCCRNDTAVKYEIARVIEQEQQAAAQATPDVHAEQTNPVPNATNAMPSSAQGATAPQSSIEAAAADLGNDANNMSTTHGNQTPNILPTTSDTEQSNDNTTNAQPAAVNLETLFDIQQVDTDQTVAQASANQANGQPDTRQDTPTATVDWEKLYLGDHPAYPPLMQRMPSSRWVRIDDEDAWYVVGLLYDSNNTPTHACYGVYGSYNVPLCPQAEWLPQSVDDWHGQGYWIIYQQLQLPVDTAG